ncbi:MAG: nucleoside monophosphate kinase [Candidatus Pacebacteria bacterium]|nr:nucleoside monophosphate kinase [Candidatus Paceibacterota bacterium]
MKKAIIIFGAPGSGKGTQTYLLGAIKGFFNFDTGRYIEQTIYDPANKNNKIIQREKKNFETGKLCTPSWASAIVNKKAAQLAKTGMDVTFTGSPRTMFEAFGGSGNNGFIKTLERVYGRKNTIFLTLNVSPKTSIYRNSNRRICSLCSVSIIYKKNSPSTCPICNSPTKKRTLDKPEIIKVRLDEYHNRTQPIFKKLKSMGHKINLINGEQPPYKVFKDILSKIK